MNQSATPAVITVATMQGVYEVPSEKQEEYFRRMNNGGNADAVLCHLGVPVKTPASEKLTGKRASGAILDDRAQSPSTYDQRAAEALLAQTAAAAQAKKTATERQVGGQHYKGLQIQPGTFAHKNGLTFYEGCVIKRVCRHSRGGKGRQDIEKAIHELQIILELEYGDDSAT